MIRTPTGETCPACGGRQKRVLFSATDRLYRTTHKQFSVVECSGCRLLRLYPWPAPEELKEYYPKNYWFAPEGAAGKLEDLYRRFVLRDHVNFVDRALRESGETGPVVDVGCGGGLFTRLLADRGYKTIGVDNSEQAARVAWKLNRVPAFIAALPSAPLRQGVCAGITMFHVLEHLYDPAAYLDAAHALLQPEGRLVVQVPNAACWQFLILGENWNGVDVPRHLVNFRDSDMDKLLEHCGFEVLRHKHFSLRDNPAGLASSLAAGLDPMARRIRNKTESPRVRLLRDALYFAIVMASLPFAALEAACGAGSTVMIEARKKR